jgi:hypothetical protein
LSRAATVSKPGIRCRTRQQKSIFAGTLRERRWRQPTRQLASRSRVSGKPRSSSSGTGFGRCRPQTNGHVEALHKTILEECWRPAFARYLYPRFRGLRRELDRYLAFYNRDRVHHGRLTRGRIPADIVYGPRKMKAR